MSQDIPRPACLPNFSFFHLFLQFEPHSLVPGSAFESRTRWPLHTVLSPLGWFALILMLGSAEDNTKLSTKRWPLKTPNPPLQGVLTRVTLINSRKFLPRWFSTLPPKCTPQPSSTQEEWKQLSQREARPFSVSLYTGPANEWLGPTFSEFHMCSYSCVQRKTDTFAWRGSYKPIKWMLLFSSRSP